MLVFIDESGDSGFKFDKGSSPYFVITAVIFADNFSSLACERTIGEIRQENKLPCSHEFHFTNTSNRLRQAFLRKVAQDQFFYHAFVLNKRCLYDGSLREPEQFYRFAVGIVCDNASSMLDDAKVVIDKCGDRKFAQRLERALKSQMNTADGRRRIRKVGMQESCNNDLIQLADMVCGAVRCRYAADIPQSEHWDAIKKKEKRVQFWPSKQ